VLPALPERPAESAPALPARCPRGAPTERALRDAAVAERRGRRRSGASAEVRHPPIRGGPLEPFPRPPRGVWRAPPPAFGQSTCPFPAGRRPAARLRTGFSGPASERVSPGPPQNGFLRARLRTGFSGRAPASVGTGPPRGSRAGAARLERADEVWRRRALCRVRVAAAALALTGWGGRCAVRHVTVQLAEPADRGRRVGRAWSVVPD
jgi:hypothetical protein